MSLSRTERQISRSDRHVSLLVGVCESLTTSFLVASFKVDVNCRSSREQRQLEAFWCGEPHAAM